MNKTVQQMINELKASKAEYILYDGCDVAIKRVDAIAEISHMDDDEIGEGFWYESDKNGNLI